MSTQSYTVTTAAVNIEVAPRTAHSKAEVTRLVAGDEIKADPNNQSIRDLLSHRAITLTSKIDPAKNQNLNARRVFELARRSGEAVAVVDQAAVPLDAPRSDVEDANR